MLACSSQAEGEKTVVLAAPKQGQLQQLQAQARDLDLPTFLVGLCCLCTSSCSNLDRT